LRPLELADAGQVQKLFPHWEIVRYLEKGVPWPYPADGAYSFIRNVALPAMERGESWNWTLRLKTAPAAIIGSIALRKGNHKNRGFWMGTAWQRQGFMSEACDVVTDYWFTVLKMPVMKVPKAVANVASSRISARQGMRMIGLEEHDYVCGRLPSEVWEITAEEWQRRKRR
jgi:RimJ/RimL family protein N-acetyltransferase